MEFIPAKTIISGYSEGNLWFGDNYNMNIYKGCCHGC
ncbi:MAG: radical SAM protein, partial [Firmicutes bacterium]|nr:radical SAM protein [Bacillota bacterium]